MFILCGYYYFVLVGHIRVFLAIVAESSGIEGVPFTEVAPLNRCYNSIFIQAFQRFLRTIPSYVHFFHFTQKTSNISKKYDIFSET